MSAKHTPGPWQVTNGKDIFSLLGAKRADGTEADSNDGWHIADCSPGGTFVGGELVDMSCAEQKANARLIAAAPELLEACQALIDYCDKNPPMGDSLWSVQQIRAAIKKATGEPL